MGLHWAPRSDRNHKAATTAATEAGLHTPQLKIALRTKIPVGRGLGDAAKKGVRHAVSML